MKFFKWINGRQGGGYKKMYLFESKCLKLDIVLISFEEGQGIHPHTDPCLAGVEHHRVNLFLQSAKLGGRAYFSDPQPTRGQFLGMSWHKFRPDISKHLLTSVIEGSVLILSIGWLKTTK